MFYLSVENKSRFLLIGMDPLRHRIGDSRDGEFLEGRGHGAMQQRVNPKGRCAEHDQHDDEAGGQIQICAAWRL